MGRLFAPADKRSQKASAGNLCGIDTLRYAEVNVLDRLFSDEDEVAPRKVEISFLPFRFYRARPRALSFPWTVGSLP